MSLKWFFKVNPCFERHGKGKVRVMRPRIKLYELERRVNDVLCFCNEGLVKKSGECLDNLKVHTAETILGLKHPREPFHVFN